MFLSLQGSYLDIRNCYIDKCIMFLSLQDVTDPSKCINDQTLRSDTEFCQTSLLKLSDQIVQQNPPRSE